VNQGEKIAPPAKRNERPCMIASPAPCYSNWPLNQPRLDHHIDS
jgi:hypothetical protein